MAGNADDRAGSTLSSLAPYHGTIAIMQTPNNLISVLEDERKRIDLFQYFWDRRWVEGSIVFGL